MSSLTFSSQESLLQFIKENLQSDGTISIRAVSKLCGVEDTAIIRCADFRSQKLAQKLTAQGFKAADLTSHGFNSQATWLVIEYFAYESKADAPQAKALARTFGTIGIIETFSQLNKPQQPQFDLPKNYLEALKCLVKVEEEKELLTQKIALDAPYTALGQHIEVAKGDLKVGEYGKIIGIGQNKLFGMLRDKGILSSNSSNWNVPYQKFIDAGYFRLTEKMTPVKLETVSLITPKGQVWLQKQLSNVLVLKGA